MIEAGVFSILADECKDLSKREQMSIVVRYVDNKATVYEHFLTFVELVSLTAESLAKCILNTLQELHLSTDCILSQCYDGASVMSKKCLVLVNSLLYWKQCMSSFQLQKHM